uniref:Uncharacterized protein n=1 Tax=Physcomitrium patens TaxID=3218 RepID=A0A2K1JLN2_PHYPA|nr:hypothetical protein PHYPA_017276 [Physcomitrium patens]
MTQPTKRRTRLVQERERAREREMPASMFHPSARNRIHRRMPSLQCSSRGADFRPCGDISEPSRQCESDSVGHLLILPDPLCVCVCARFSGVPVAGSSMEIPSSPPETRFAEYIYIYIYIYIYT